jgi:hypothetical protein
MKRKNSKKLALHKMTINTLRQQQVKGGITASLAVTCRDTCIKTVDSVYVDCTIDFVSYPNCNTLNCETLRLTCGETCTETVKSCVTCGLEAC